MTPPRCWWHAVLLGVAAGCGARQSSADLQEQPVLYGAGLFSTGAWDFFVAVAPDGSRVLFCRATDDFNRYTVYETRLEPDGHFSTPAIPDFAARWSNADPHFTPDGRMVYFVSNRPAPHDTAASSTYDIWRVSLSSGGAWGEPELVPPPISLPGRDEWSPSVAANGNLYFGSERPGGLGGMDLWVARRSASGYRDPENLGGAINTAGDEVEPWVAPDESYLIFSGKGRADSVGGYDLYQSSPGPWHLGSGPPPGPRGQRPVE
jgi:Tol biopolymer transport system component